MKKIFIYSILMLSAGIFLGCKKGNYPGATVSPYISIFDVRNIFKGNDITLDTDNMFGADKITAVVVSDHSGGNLPPGLLIVQDSRRLGQLRGIAIPIGNEAANYVPGDSVIINVAGKVLKSVDGMLQLTGVGASDITKVASGVAIAPSIVTSNKILANPGNYQSTLVTITSAGFDPSYPAGSTYAGDRIINDGFGNIVLHTEPTASFANDVLPYLSNFTGIVFVATDGSPQLRPRVDGDITILSSTAPKIAAMVISGYLTDPSGSDANYEYIQFRATKDINFALTPFSVVTTNNAGTNVPTGFPANGWATGGLRTYKINLTSGTVLKGEYFYVGGNPKIWGGSSTDISSSKFFTKLYATVDGDGFGTKTTNLLANSGNAGGIAVFETTTVDEQSVPDDVVFYGGAGSLYTAGPPERGYRITNTDYYDKTNPVTLNDQPFYAMGSNTGKFSFPTTGNFSKLGGTYNKVTGRWTQARMLTSVP
ncbi:MAG: hypothetical protein H0U44_10245, partial [Flavisolibacter sp.]|nr:hypothetical protein [Flavisolibacter sp.]